MPIRSKLLNIIVCICVALLPSVSVAYGQQAGDVSRIRTVVIDPGHGGKDPGTISRNGKYKEKNITLSVALKLGELIKTSFPHIKVIYTRSSDKYVELGERAAVANRNKADLFISIHVNSAKATSARGSETFVMGAHKSEDNFEVCKTENSVIVIEDDYQTKYEGFNPNSPESYIIFSLLQNVHQGQSIEYAALVQSQFAKGPIPVNRGVKQGGLVVLWKTTMPAVLTELGFLSNSKDYAVLVSRSGQEQLARRLYNAFVAYKSNFENSGVAAVTDNSATPDSGNAVPDETDITAANVADTKYPENDFYSVQILSVGKVLKANAYDLKGRKDARYIKVGGLYKYHIGKYRTRKEASSALGTIRKTFPGAFVIHVKNNEIVKD